MVSLSFCVITFQLLLVLPLLLVTQSATSTTDTGEVLASGVSEISKPVVSPRMGTLDLHQQKPDEEVSNTRFLGRKKMSTRTFGMLREEVAYLNGRQSSKSASTSSPSALPLKNSVNINARPERLRNTRGGRPRTHRRLKERIASNFIPLNADYHVPRPHPPKNN